MPDVVHTIIMFSRTLKCLSLTALLTLGSTTALSGAHSFQIPPSYEVAETLCKLTFEDFHLQIKPLGDLISKGEGDYNAVNRGYAGDTPGGIKGLTGLTFENYTVGQVIDMQRRRVYAVGRYQFIPSTLRFAVAMSDVDELDMFTPDTQDKLFAALILFKRPAVGAYLRGNHDHIGWALNELAKEWASVEYRHGRGFYDHVGGNRAHITRSDAKKTLESVRATIAK